MKWTKEKPTEPGTWIFQDNSPAPLICGNVRYGEWSKAQNPQLLYLNDRSVVNRLGLWFGPIPDSSDKTSYMPPEENKKLDTMVENLEHLAGELQEKRSDIAEILESIVSGEFKYPKTLTYVEHRFIDGKIKLGENWYIKVQYDTLTTLLSYEVITKSDKKFLLSECVEMEYYD